MTRPSIQIQAPRDLGPRTWGHELLFAKTTTYIGKVLEMRAGTAGGLQYHVNKVETFYLHSGIAFVDYDADGTLTTIRMYPGMAVHVPAGAPHRVRAITDCTFFEVSTPHFDDRVRVEADYGEPEVGGLPSTHDAISDSTGQA